MLVSTHSSNRGYKRTSRSNLVVWMVAVKEMIDEIHKKGKIVSCGLPLPQNMGTLNWAIIYYCLVLLKLNPNT